MESFSSAAIASRLAKGSIFDLENTEISCKLSTVCCRLLCLTGSKRRAREGVSSFGASVVVVLPPDLGRRFLPLWRILSLSRLFSRKFLGVVVVLMVVVVVMSGAGEGFKLVLRKAGITCDLC